MLEVVNGHAPAPAPVLSGSEVSEEDPEAELPDYCARDVPWSHTVYVQGADGVFTERN